MKKSASVQKTKRFRDCERRLVLLDWLRTRYDHPSAMACYAEMQRLMPTIGQSTVYRHLASLVKTGLVKELRPDDGPARFDASLHVHAHFHCVHCHAVLDAPGITIQGQWPGNAQAVDVIANGLCQNCSPRHK